MKIQKIKNTVINLLLTLILITAMLVSISTPITAGEVNPNSQPRAAYDFEIEFSVDSNSIEPNQQELFDLKLSNLGDNPDNYDLVTSGVPVGWTVKLMHNGKEITQLNLDQGKSETLQVIIKVSASGNSTITVTADSDFAGSKDASITITVGYVIKIDCLNPSQYLGAGDAVTFELDITNYQDISDTVTLDTDTTFQLGTQPDEDEWVISFSQYTPTIPASESKKIDLKIFAPLNSVPPQKESFKVVGTSGNTAEKFYSNQIEAIIKNIYNITSTVTPSSPKVDPGEVINYTITISNKGNTEDKIMLTTLDNFNNWAVSLKINDDPFQLNQDELILEPDESKTIKAEVTVPSTAPTGVHNLEIGVSSSGGDHENISISTEVNQVYSLKLELVEDGYVVDIAATTYVKTIVKNTGNGQDTLTLQIPTSYLPDNWDIFIHSVETSEIINNTNKVDFSQAFSIIGAEKTRFQTNDGLKYDQVSLMMSSGQSAYVTFGVTTPQQGSWGNNSFVVYGETFNIVNKDTELLTVAVILRTSDLEFVGVPELSAQNLTLGDTLEIDIEVRNNFHVSANNFKVILYQGNLPGQEDQLIERENIDNIAPNSTQKVTLSWSIPDNAPEGTYLLKIRMEGNILPSNDLPEKNIAVSVSEGEEETEDDSMLLLLIIVIIVIIIVIIVLIVTLKMRGKANEPEPEPESEPVSSKPTPDFGKRKKLPRKVPKMKKRAKM